MAEIGPLISDLNADDHPDEGFGIKNSHGQHGPEQNPKLRERNEWCFFSPAES